MNATRRTKSAPLGLALAGGGPEGALYEIGALFAFEEAIEGIDFADLDIYVGVSAGAFVSACLANGIRTRDLCRAVVSDVPGDHPLTPRVLFTPAIGEWAHRGSELPRLVFDTIHELALERGDGNFFGSLMRLSRALPAGIFNNDPLRDYLQRSFNRRGRTDNFRRLDRQLIIVATDLDSGDARRFGEPGWDHVPISVAVQASTALPGLYPPVRVEGRDFVDGVLLKTLHASVALEAGVKLLICINPIVPVDTSSAVERGFMRRGNLVNRGLPALLSQTFRTMIHSRMRAGFAGYASSYPDRDIVLIEPRRDDYRMFFTNVFSFASRRAVCQHAYAATRVDLRERRDELEPLLARHGMRFRDDILADESRSLWSVIETGRQDRRGGPITEQLGRALGRLEAYLDELTAEADA